MSFWTAVRLFMITPQKHHMNKQDRHQELFQTLSALLTSRDQGLLNQADYEHKLDELRTTLPPQTVLMEVDLRGGGTRFLLKRSVTGEILDLFDFRRFYCRDL
jgi:hypothetical protein